MEDDVGTEDRNYFLRFLLKVPAFGFFVFKAKAIDLRNKGTEKHFKLRFLSADPVINKDEAVTNPQLWNLYSYCQNNPVTSLDPDGGDVFKSITDWWAGTLFKHFVSGDFEGGLEIIADCIDEDMMSSDLALGFVGGIEYAKKYLILVENWVA